MSSPRGSLLSLINRPTSSHLQLRPRSGSPLSLLRTMSISPRRPMSSSQRIASRGSSVSDPPQLVSPSRRLLSASPPHRRDASQGLQLQQQHPLTNKILLITHNDDSSKSLPSRSSSAPPSPSERSGGQDDLIGGRALSTGGFCLSPPLSRYLSSSPKIHPISSSFTSATFLRVCVSQVDPQHRPALLLTPTTQG